MSWTIERRGRVAVVTMTTNPVNAQNQAFFADLHDAFDRLERDHRDSPVVLTGTGLRFSAGLDLDERLGRGALADPDRGWDVIVIGEYEQAFYASQYASMAPLFEHYGVSLWLPEVGGRVDWHAEDHEQTMLALGLVVQAGDHPDQDPGAHRDGRADPGARPLPGRPGRPTGTGWAMRGRIRTRRTRRGDAGPTGWNPTRRPRR